MRVELPGEIRFSVETQQPIESKYNFHERKIEWEEWENTDAFDEIREINNKG